MNMKKSVIAMAVSGAVGAPVGAAQAAEVYGFVNVTLENVSVGGDGTGASLPTDAAGNAGFANFVTGDDDSGLVLSDIAESRIGVRGSEDLGNGLTAGYRIEYGMGTSAFDEPGGSVEEDGDFEQRLAWASLSGDFGQIKLGQQWGVLYEYSGWNIFRSDGNGGAGYYWATALLNHDWFGLRVPAVTYTYGGGGYSSDPFTFSVQAIMDQSQSGEGDPSKPSPINDTDDEETVDALVLGGQATFGEVTVNAVSYSENNTQKDTTGASANVPELTLTSLGARWSRGPWYVGGSYLLLDRDNPAGNEPSVLIGLAGYDFGGGVSGYAGVSSGDADTSGGSGDLTSFFLQGQKAFSSRTKIYFEFESTTTDKTAPGGDDGEADVLAAGIKHSF